MAFEKKSAVPTSLIGRAGDASGALLNLNGGTRHVSITLRRDLFAEMNRLQRDMQQALDPSPSIRGLGRTFRLSQELDPSKVTAKLVHGVLTLSLPKAEHAQPRRIHVDG